MPQGCSVRHSPQRTCKTRASLPVVRCAENSLGGSRLRTQQTRGIGADENSPRRRVNRPSRMRRMPHAARTRITRRITAIGLLASRLVPPFFRTRWPMRIIPPPSSRKDQQLVWSLHPHSTMSRRGMFPPRAARHAHLRFPPGQRRNMMQNFPRPQQLVRPPSYQRITLYQPPKPPSPIPPLEPPSPVPPEPPPQPPPHPLPPEPPTQPPPDPIPPKPSMAVPVRQHLQGMANDKGPEDQENHWSSF